MGHAVIALSSLAESWNPVKPDSDVRRGIGMDKALPSNSSHSSTTPESLPPFAMSRPLNHSAKA